MTCIGINKFITYSLFPPKVLFDIMIESEKILRNPNYIIEKKNNSVLDIMIKSYPKPIYFYNGPDHIKSCIYTDEQYYNELLPNLTKRLKRHNKLKKFNNLALKDHIDSKWRKYKQDIYINSITTVVKFIDLNSSDSADFLLNLKKNIQPELSIENKELLKLKKEYTKYNS